jgi:plastocyanin
MSDLFYVFGIALVVLALIVSFAGLRSERFPGSRGLYAAVIGVMGALVVASCAFAVVLSREEADHREEEVAEFEAEQQEAEEAAAAEEETEDPGTAPPAGEGQIETEAEAETLELTSPEAGDLLFEPEQLKARAGEITIEYTNPSEVPHNVAIESADGEELAQGETVTAGASGPATAALESGEYTYFCSIPGHREAGMEGTLTVD